MSTTKQLVPAVPEVLTDEQIDAVLDSHGNMAYVIADKRERLRMFAREILRAAMLAQPVIPVEPTAYMQAAGAAAIRFDTTPINKLFTANAVYRAMLAAASEVP